MNISEINKLVEDYGKDIYSFCKKLTYNEYDAEELYQDTFLKVMDVADRIDAENNPKSYLISVSISLWNNKKRKYARRNRIAPTEHIDEENSINIYKTDYTPEDEVVKKELYELINKVVSELDDKMRIPFLLFYNSGMSVENISKVVDCPVGTVKSRLFNARTIIKNKLEVYGVDRAWIWELVTVII